MRKMSNVQSAITSKVTTGSTERLKRALIILVRVRDGLPKPKQTSVESDALRKLKIKGAVSPLLDARLRFMEVEGTARYVRMMEGRERVYPNMLPTQASGRWSTPSPPLPNFPPDCVNPLCSRVGTEHAYATEKCWSARDIVAPDLGWWWLHYDLDSIEAKWAAADAGDMDDLEAFAKGYDVHTIRTCRALRHALPPVLTKSLHTDPSCQAWRDSWNPPWSGSEDRRRHIFKTVGYATQFCISPKGVLAAKGVDALGLTPDEIVRFAKTYIASKPTLQNRKRQVWDESAKTAVSYTWYGRRRRLYGDWNTRAKEGWSHRISGTVTDYQNQVVIAVDRKFPESYLVLNSHDGLTWAFPVTTTQEMVMAYLKPLVEKDVTSPTGHTVKVTASWERVNTDLTRSAVKATG